jgi:amidase
MGPHVLSDTSVREPITHAFAPSSFSLIYSAAIAPVLRLRPGDSVQTTTLDNNGSDADGIARSYPGNPLTGPFHIESAKRGDTLAITFNRIRPNRDFARSGARFHRQTVTADYRRHARYDASTTEWRIDRQQSTARLASPSTALAGLTVPLRPFLGSVGVAPPSDQAFGTRWLGPWGGNLDYNRLVEGTTLYLPVFQSGALLSIGDGHAAQGDGEITGDALETSMDVEFTVDVLPRTSFPAIEAPRAESSTELMALGIAVSMTDAFQQATSVMADWIAGAYNLTCGEAALLLATLVQYDIAEVVNPSVNVVARLPKAPLTMHDKSMGALSLSNPAGC